MHFIARRYSSSRELGWTIYNPANRGRGYASEAVAALVDYLFRAHPINRVECCVSPGNRASARVAEKCGFVKEGTLRELIFVGGRFLDGDAFSILRSEWERRQASVA